MKNRTELNLTVLTDYEHEAGDVLERVRQEIEIAGFHLQTLFNSLKRSALYVENVFSEDENETVKGFCSDLMHTADIGNGVAMAIWKSISDLTELQMNETTVNINAESEVDALAVQLSAVLNNPLLPVSVHNAIMHSVDDILNESDSDVLEKFETSPEYLKAALTVKNSSEASR